MGPVEVESRQMIMEAADDLQLGILRDPQFLFGAALMIGEIVFVFIGRSR